MTVRVRGAIGSPAHATSGQYPGEVFVNDAGVYIGDFTAGSVTDDPRSGIIDYTVLGFAHGTKGVYTYPAPLDYLTEVNFQALWGLYWDDCSDHLLSAIAYLLNANPVESGVPQSQIGDENLSIGPPGLEDKPVCEIWFAGSTGALYWVGETASLVPGVQPYSGGWYPTLGSRWTISGWFRSAYPAGYGLDVGGYGGGGFGTSGGGYSAGFGVGAYGHGGTWVAELTLTTEWQYLEHTFTWWWSSTWPGIPFVGSRDPNLLFPYTQPVLVKKNPDEFLVVTKLAGFYPGPLHVKELHLYPAGNRPISGAVRFRQHF